MTIIANPTDLTSTDKASRYDSEWECVCERQQVEVYTGYCMVVLDIEYCG